jgi:hypothetical protein
VDLYFAGAEQPVYLKMLNELGAQRIAISFYEWQRRHSTDHLFKHIPEGMQVIVTPGVAKKETLDWEAFATDYLEFCERNQDDCLIYDFDAPFCPQGVREEVRNQLSIMTNVIMFPMETETLDQLCATYERVGINSRTAKSMDPNDLRRVQATLHGSNITDPKVLRLGKFAATTSFAWLSAKRYGEMWIFARNKLRHYGADKLVPAVKAHTRDIEHFGVSAEACAENDRDALTAVAVYSLLAMAESLSKRPRDRRQVEIVDASPEDSGEQPLADGSAPPGALVAGNGVLPVVERERIMLPVISMNTEAEPPRMTTNSHSLRQCDACYLSGSCPKYQPESACAFEFPVEIRTDAQWEQASQVILEMQFERINFARFGEQVEGSGLSARVGQEMDRFFKLLESVKSLKAPVADPNAGAFSRIFGVADQPALGEGDDDDDQEEGSTWIEGEGYEEDDEGSWAAEQSGVGATLIEEG